MPYALEFYLLLFVAEVAVFLVARSLAPLGLGVNSVFAFAAAYVAIVIGRWVLGRKNLDASTALAMLTNALSRCHSECARLKCSPRSDRSRCARTRPAGLKALTLIDRYVPMRMLVP